jgi:hypothetical protein
MAGTSDALSCGLIDQFIPTASTDGEHPLSLGLFHALFLGLLLLGCLFLGITRTLFAPLVFTLDTHLVRAVEGSAAMAAAVDTHTNRFLDTLDWEFGGWRSDPLMRFECEAVLGE